MGSIDHARLAELERLGSKHFWPHNRPIGHVAEDGVRVVVRGEGIWVEDARGKRWLDMMSGMWLKNVGHGRKEIAEAVARQMEALSYAPGGTVSPVTIELAARIAAHAPDKESRVFFVSGGGEAVETALKMARRYHRHRKEPGRYKIIGRRGSFHGATLATIGIGLSPSLAPSEYGPYLPGCVQVAQVDHFRCPFCKDRPACTSECARDLERAILHEGPSTVAAFIAEPISSAHGVHVPPPDYWPTVRKICDRYGVVLIVDEVVTGLGRTGKMFAIEHWGVQPDIITVAKGLTSGYLPIGAAIASKRFADTFAVPDGFRHLVTFGGNPASCAAGLANLDILEREHLVENSARLGVYLLERLGELRQYPIVVDVRGLGLLCAVELARDRQTREPFPPEVGMMKLVDAAFTEHGLLGRGLDTIHIAPPLSITRDEIDELVSRLHKVLVDLTARLSGSMAAP
jgi:adenosylmethionine-8-amino-7-oxononanoate aminotransferase